jgi:hypothetical protein
MWDQSSGVGYFEPLRTERKSLAINLPQVSISHGAQKMEQSMTPEQFKLDVRGFTSSGVDWENVIRALDRNDLGNHWELVWGSYTKSVHFCLGHSTTSVVYSVSGWTEAFSSL